MPSRRLPSLLVAALFLAVAAGASMASEKAAESGGEPERAFDYLALTPAFVVNYGTSGKVGFLKADVSLRVATAAKAAVELHMPAIRHELIMLLSAQDEESLASAPAHEDLRLTALESVRRLLEEAAGTRPEEIQDLLFTSFITQR